MYCSHQAAFDTPVVIQYLGNGSQTVGGAGSRRNDGFTGVFLVVHAVHEHGGIILARCRLNHLLGTSSDVCLTRFFCKEKAGAIDNEISADFIPFQFGWVFDRSQANLLAIHNHVAAID